MIELDRLVIAVGKTVALIGGTACAIAGVIAGWWVLNWAFGWWGPVGFLFFVIFALMVASVYEPS